MKTITKAIGMLAILLLVTAGIALYLQHKLPPDYADEACKYLGVIVGGMIFSMGFVIFVLPKMMFPFLSDAQRYGIDENAIPQTPDREETACKSK